MKKISHYIARYWYLYLFALVGLVIQVGLEMISPQILKRIVDDVIMEGKLEELTPLLIAILVIGAGRCVFGYAKEFTFDCAGSKIATDMRRDLFRHIQTLSVNFFDKTNTGELMSRVKDDIDRIWNATCFISMLIIEVLLHSFLALYFMFRLNPKLFLLPAISMPIVGIIAIVMEKKLDRVYEEISEENAEMNTVAQENIAGVRTVKAFAREKFEINKFLSHNRRYYELNMKQSRVFIKYQPMFQFITKLLPAMTIVLGGFMVIRDEMSLGTLSAFADYCSNVIWPMEMLGWLSNDFASAIASSKKLKKIYAEHPLITEPEQPVSIAPVKGHITFDKVSFSVDGKEILTDISFELPAGKTLGIMGATGTGKTSVINLLQRFYDVNEGQILLDGVDIRKLSFETLRGSMALVMQDVFLFSDTICENVKLGRRALIQKPQVEQALQRAQASEFVDKLEEKSETLIGERGVGLSGGQKQRISIARALAKEAPILILDDSTSALDMETEQEIQHMLNTLTGITKLIIAHRISAVRAADEIIILDDARIIERGTHESLLAQKGYYYKTYLAQYGEFLGENGSSVA